MLTSGTFDILHLGHCKYLERAKESFGDRETTILLVGVDSDAKVKQSKGQGRPIVDEVERLEIVCHIAHTDYVFKKPIEEEKWKLIKTVRPDILVISERSGYSEEDKKELLTYCKKVINLESQATSSTTARIRTLLVSHSNALKEMFDKLRNKINTGFEEFEKDFSGFIRKGPGDE